MATTRTNSLGMLLGVALGLVLALPAAAGAQTVTAYTGQSCAGTRYGSNLGCTSKDFTTTATFTQPPPALASCIAGSVITLDVISSITSNSPTRYDGAIFLGERGNDPSLNDASKTCSLGVFPSSPAPFLNQDGDQVGDFQGTSSATLTVQGVVAYCAPVAGTNVLGLPYTLVFDNQSSPGATPANVTAGGPAKCVNTTAAQVTGVIVQGWIRLTVATTPPGDPQAFPFTTSGTAAASPDSFSLSAGQTQTVQIPLSPTGGTQTVQIDETLVAGWVSTAAITCTSPTGGAAPYVTTDGANRRITAVLDATNHGAICTLTNTKLARVTVVEQSAGGTGSFAFTSGTNGLPASFTLDTGVSNPASAGPFIVTANGAPITIAQTVPAGWTLASAGCSDGVSSVGSLSGSTLNIAGAEVTPGRNITCTFANTRKATLTKAFSPAAVGTGAPSTLTFTVTNRPGAPAQPDLGFTDTFPAGLVVASPLAASSTCGGTLTRVGAATPLAAGDPGLTFAGGSLSAGTASCTVSVAVSSATVGSYVNGPGQVSGVTGGLESGVTDQTLTVYPLPNLLLVKSADAATVRPGDVVTWTLVVQNSGPGEATTVVLSDPISRHLALGVDAFGPGVPFQFTDGAPVSGLVPGTPAYSADGGATWTLVPVSGGGGAPAGFDARVTNWRLPMTGTMPAGSQFTLTFKAAVK
ncbi:MAG TPA: hypothetical protein VLS93_11490 [Anaeromyxobacteraceae bacterium]|nr:hypothetical protein [Anaeromyxobacteraceae bacterium]